VDSFDRISPCSTEDASCGRQFIETFGRRAFRRPLAAEELERYVAFFETQRTSSNFRVAARLVIQALLESPQFLYRLELEGAAGKRAPLQPYELASRLSYGLWQTMPDETLLAAAEAGELATADEVEAQARRMLADPKARAMVFDFHRQWLDLDRLMRVNKDNLTYPQWNEALRLAMREETQRFIEDVIFDGDGKLRTLLSSSQTWVNPALATLYGAPAVSGWQKVTLDPAQRAGLLTHASFLAGHAHVINPSPVLRGVFAFDRVLCAPLPPPVGINTTPPEISDFDMPTTNRQRYKQHQAPGCESCHKRIDSIGFALENYDAIGAFRTEENGLPIDARTELTGTDVDGPIANGVELAHKLAGSAKVRRCYVNQWFRFTLGRGEEMDDASTLDWLDHHFVESGERVIDLIVAITRSDEFRTRMAGGQ
jgi:hypothetical protein